MDNTVYKGFIRDWAGRTMLPITRGELVLDSNGNIALQSEQFLAKDGHPGLITSTERALISSLSGTGGPLEQVADIYEKLTYLNVLNFNGTAVNFFNTTSSEQTPIKIFSKDNTINIAVNTLTNEVNFSLPILNQQETQIENTIIRNVTIDKHGRITGISGSNLINEDIPNVLVGKTLQECVTSSDVIPDNDLAVVNKGYVDNKFNNISLVNTGALKFGGVLSSAITAEATLTNKDCWDCYYKITGSFEINKTDLFDQVGIAGDTLKVKVGDTLIVHANNDTDTKAKFMYVPSGDDITSVAVTTDNDLNPPFPSYAGNVVLKFNNIFNVVKQGTNTAYVTLPAATKDNGGYLTKDDWVKFNSYSSQLSTTYQGEFDEGVGVYKIGTLTIGGVEEIIYGKYSATTISLENGTGNLPEYNPILKFTTDTQDVNIAIKGLNGITTKKNGNAVEIGAANVIIEQDVPLAKNPRKVKYLTLEDGYKFGVQIGKANEITGDLIQDGLVDFSLFNALANNVKYTSIFEVITYSLKGAENPDEYRYGNQRLIDAITLETI